MVLCRASQRRRLRYPSNPPMAISKPSKSAKKREYLALQALGERLIELSHEQLSAIALDDGLRNAIVEAKSISSHGALRRQKQLIGKLMRQEDPEPIENALETFTKNDNIGKNIFRRAERWRDRFANEVPPPLEEYVIDVGADSSRLAPLCQSLSGAQNDKQRREILRKIFREIHQDLVSKMHSDRV